ncbi:MAG: NADH-quinone oxidoreductase subunit J [Oleiharenicola lentus]
MADLVFHILALMTIGSALAVVLNKDAVNAALCLLLSLVGLAGLFVLLDAALLAFVLLLVYAGAVVALFLFIIMLLDTTPGARKPFGKFSIAAAVLGGALLFVGAHMVGVNAPKAAAVHAAPTLKNYAELLFTTYLLPVQVVGFMLLIGMLGVIVLSRKFDQEAAR